MNIFAIGDLHLSFSVGPEKAMDIFGGAWVNHAEKLKTNWLRQVAEEDLVIMPGDFSWALKLEEAKADFDWLKELPGKKVFVRGNHDLWWGSLKKMKTLYPEVEFIQNNSLIIGGVALFGSRGWIHPEDPDFKEDIDRSIYERERLRFQMSFDTLKDQSYDRLICVTHYPPYGFMDLFEKYGVDQVIYGHLHGMQAFKTGPQGLINGIDYKLCSLDKLEASPLLIMKG